MGTKKNNHGGLLWEELRAARLCWQLKTNELEEVLQRFNILRYGLVADLAQAIDRAEQRFLIVKRLLGLEAEAERLVRDRQG